jgi:hypothetical protein
MSEQYYIVDEPLPLSQDFNSLKELGRTFIQDHSGNEWTNLNSSDPGMTILDQLCYALTELGYCNDFPVSDILTDKNGKLETKDQFYLPENILTTTPVTAQDYRKYIIDGVEGVNNVVILTCLENNSFIKKAFQVYLMIDESLTGVKAENVCRETFYLLNKSRNLGELFLFPKPLEAAVYDLNGTIEIDNPNELSKILSVIQKNIRNYILPEVSPSSYTQLAEKGESSNILFDGPRLQDGWIPDDALGNKLNELDAFEIVKIIEAVPGVIAVSGINFLSNNVSLVKITSQPDQLLMINVVNSYNLDYLKVSSNIQSPGSKQISVSPDASLSGNETFEKNILVGTVTDISPELPVGKNREINSYYSIQNTFPEIYAVGLNAVTANASEFQIAQSRQLKGYLTLFDQLLANQFSQLANINSLFSFRNSMTGTPSDRHKFYEQKDDYQKKHLEYPVPYVKFSPTYFYQSLYDIPNIRPLLKDDYAFMYSMQIKSDKILDKASWHKYKHDPYNSYMLGLSELMEDEKTNLIRRNDMLDHLLARHGESPSMINSIIGSSVYSGEALKDRVIFKSEYLQNLGLLSYYRCKAFNYQGAEKIAETTAGIVSVELPIVTNEIYQEILDGNSRDFIFNSGKANRLDKVTEQDCINYSAFELKLNLLFGLRMLYEDFIAENYLEINPGDFTPRSSGDTNISLKNSQALWFIEKRKGFILVEMPLLFRSFTFRVSLIQSKGEGKEQLSQIENDLDYDNARSLILTLLSHGQKELDQLTHSNSGENPDFYIGKNIFKIKARDITSGIYKGAMQVGQTDYSIAINVVYPESESKELKPAEYISGSELEIPVANFINSVEIFFPQFMPPFQTTDFSNRVELFSEYDLAVNVQYQLHLVQDKHLDKLIPAYIGWHESIRFGNTLKGPEFIYALELLLIISRIYLADNS